MICHDLSCKWRASKRVKCRQGLYPTPERLDAVLKFLRTLQNVDVKASGITDVRPKRKHWHYKYGKPRLINELHGTTGKPNVLRFNNALNQADSGLEKKHRYQNVTRFVCHSFEKLASCTESSTHQLFLSRLSYIILILKYTIYTVLEDLIWTWKRITLENPSRCTMLCAHFLCFLSLSLSLDFLFMYLIIVCLP